MSENISSLMEPQVFCVEMDDTLAEIERLFTSKGLTWAPVLDSGRSVLTVLGVVSASDLVRVRAQAEDPNSARAWQLCTYKPISVTADTPISEVARLMVERKIHHVVVTKDDGIVGVVSSLDFVRTFVRP